MSNLALSPELNGSNFVKLLNMQRTIEEVI